MSRPFCSRALVSGYTQISEQCRRVANRGFHSCDRGQLWKTLDRGDGLRDAWTQSSAFSTDATAQPEGSKVEKGLEAPVSDDFAEAAEDDIYARYSNLEKECKAGAEKVKEIQDKLLRALADQQNERSRFQREVEGARQYAISNFAKSMIEVADTMKMAMKAVSEQTMAENAQLRQIYDGIRMTDNILSSVFEKFGVTPYDPMGEYFDPKLHEAVFEMGDPTKKKGEIAQVLQCGYKIQDRVLRAAKVGVVKGSPPDS
eukprot:GHVS01074518.1.p1 GENE.GHVS01074518.1~~GHVS01074518.1.p1  ORF type:complete len:293 (+),score=29.13 GHVS01074518.1:106-879(+)